MATQPSDALRTLSDVLARLPQDQVVTVSVLKELLDEAAESVSQSEYSDYMGEDM